MCSLGKVSIVIPIRKGEDIEPILWSIKTSTYQNKETIVIDEGLERSAQRNIGIDRATGDYLLFLDSDQQLDYFVLEDCVNKIKDCQAIYIPEGIATKGWFGRLRNWERQFYTGTCVDVVRFVKNPCPYFDIEQKGTEDSDWDRRIKGKRMISKNCLYHYDNIGIIDYIKKKAYYAKSLKRFAERNPNDKILDLKYRCFWIFVENGKWKRLLRKPHYTLGLIFLLLLRGIIWKMS